MTTASSSPIQRAVTAAFGVSQSIIGAAGDIAGGTMGSTMGGEGVADRVGEMTSGRIEQLVRTPIGELHLNAVGGATLHAPATATLARTASATHTLRIGTYLLYLAPTPRRESGNGLVGRNSLAPR